MFKNYFKIAWRNLIKNKMYSFINIVGLSGGMAVATLIGLWIYNEVSFNKKFDHYSRIAQVIQNVTNNGEVQTWTSVPYPLADELRKNYGSDFKYIVMTEGWGDHTITINQKKLKETGGFFEKDAPEMFTLKMLQGSRNTLNDPSSVLISASAAKAYFGNDDPINRIIKIDQDPPVKVSGVYEDFPLNSTFAGLNFMGAWDAFYKNNDLKSMDDPWRPNFTTIFVQLNDNVDFATASARIRDAKLKRVKSQLAKKKPAVFLQPMSKLHLYSEFKNGVNVGGVIQYVWMFGIIGVFVLLLACINFMNLSTARSEKRAKEVGIRKTVGSLRTQLIKQFLSESVLVAFVSFIFSIVLVALLLPFFNSLAAKNMQMPLLSPAFWICALAFTFITGLLAGSYPALYLSKFEPIKVLKGTFRVGKYASLPRKVLVVLQFSFSIALIVGTIIVFKQIQFAKNRPINHRKEGLITVGGVTQDLPRFYDAVRNDLLATGVVDDMAGASDATTNLGAWRTGFNWEGKNPNTSPTFGFMLMTEDFGKTIGWQLKEGRDFSRDFATDSLAMILNESAVKQIGMKKDIVGQIIQYDGKNYRVIGVVKDIIQESPYSPVTPMVYLSSKEWIGCVTVAIKTGVPVKDALAKIEKAFKKYNPTLPFNYTFNDEEYAKKFADEERIGKLASFFTILAIFISCLGLFGLASFVAEQRRIEIGMRKVLGASTYALWKMLSKEFALLVIISCFIAIPIAWYYLNSWLQHYEYRTSISIWIFIASGVGALMITLITVSFQAIKAAVANPVKSLRSE